MPSLRQRDGHNRTVETHRQLQADVSESGQFEEDLFHLRLLEGVMQKSIITCDRCGETVNGKRFTARADQEWFSVRRQEEATEAADGILDLCSWDCLSKALSRHLSEPERSL
jgi:hypothetical protein